MGNLINYYQIPLESFAAGLIKRFATAFPAVGLPNYLAGMTAYGLTVPDSEDHGKSPFNTPYWDSIRVKTLPFGDDGSEEYEFPNDPLVDVYFKKKVTETEVFTGASVIEAAGVASGEFRMRGVLWNNDGQYPEDQLSELLNVFRQDATLEIMSSRYFNMIDVTYLFIESIALPGIEGFNDSQPFVITAREVRPITLDLSE